MKIYIISLEKPYQEICLIKAYKNKDEAIKEVSRLEELKTEYGRFFNVFLDELELL